MSAHCVKTVAMHRSRPPGRCLRIGFSLDARSSVKWVFDAVALLKSLPEIRLDTVFLVNSASPQAASAGTLFRRYRELRRPAPDPEEYVDLSPLLAGAATVALRCGPAAGLSAEDRAAIAERGLDVLIRFDGAPLTGGCAGLTRYGVWSIALGDPGKPLRLPPFWRELSEDEPVTTAALLVHLDCFERARVIYKYSGGTRRGVFAAANVVEPMAAAGIMAARRLLDVLDCGEDYMSNIAGPDIAAPQTTSPDWPGSLETGRFLARQSFRSLRWRLRARGRRLDWFVALRADPHSFAANTAAFTARDFLEVPSANGSSYADPFLIEWAGRRWLFVEEVPRSSARGRLSCMEILEDGRAAEPFVILEKPYHLSYPFVFRHGGEFFLLPESAENESVDLYRATRFPWDWTLEATLSEGIRLVDTTPYYRDGTWYFFTTTARPMMETFLFYSDNLTGQWRYHPANPICSDARYARGAGALIERGGTLLRPAQDCSVFYGHSIVLNEIGVLDRQRYAERPVEEIGPYWSGDLIGTHTINSSPSLEAIDGLRYRR